MQLVVTTTIINYTARGGLHHPLYSQSLQIYTPLCIYIRPYLRHFTYYGTNSCRLSFATAPI